MSHWEKVCIEPTRSLRESFQLLNETALQILLVVDESKKLLGTVCDGDLRRGILNGLELDAPLSKVMNQTPVTVTAQLSRKKVLNIMQTKMLHQLPVVDQEGCVRGLQLLDELLQRDFKANPVVIMAGGMGKRLQPLTHDCPKPMLRVGNQPILETILENFIDYGFHNFYLSVNYKREMIEDYFGDGSSWGVSIHYLREEQACGTAGALALLPRPLEQPLLMMNGDILTSLNMEALLRFHESTEAAATVCVRREKYTVPYGVMSLQSSGRVAMVEEKPTNEYFLNAGIYALSPEAVALVPEGKRYDMTDLIRDLIAGDKHVHSHLLDGYWRDIGRHDDLETAGNEFVEYF